MFKLYLGTLVCTRVATTRFTTIEVYRTHEGTFSNFRTGKIGGMSGTVFLGP